MRIEYLSIVPDGGQYFERAVRAAGLLRGYSPADQT